MSLALVELLFYGMQNKPLQGLCLRRAGCRGSAYEEQGADFAYNLETKGKTSLTPSPPHSVHEGSGENISQPGICVLGCASPTACRPL